jgi:hypothetical protein
VRACVRVRADATVPGTKIEVRDIIKQPGGLIGLTLEKLVFQRIERFTVIRWGMMT